MRNVILHLYVFSSIISLLLISISCTSVTQPSSQAYNKTESEKWAIIVGIGEYDYWDVDTLYADNDARVFAEQLGPFFGRDHIKLLVNSDATKATIMSTIQDWLEPKEAENDIVLLFFVGHGNHEYLQLYDSLQESQNNDLSPSELNVWLNILESTNIVIIIDCCESGSYSAGISSNERIIITSCTGREKCWQEKAYEHGIFSYYLINAFANLSTVDINDDYNISAEELFEYTNLEVTSEFQRYPTPSPQHPYINDNYDGELILFKYSPEG